MKNIIDNISLWFQEANSQQGSRRCLLLNSTIIAHLWKLCPKIWRYECSSYNEPSAIWEPQHPHTHIHIHKALEMIWRGFSNHCATYRKDTLRTDLLPLICRTGTLKKKLDSLFYLSGSRHHWSICLHSVVIQHLTSRMLFCPSRSHSLGEVSANRGMNVFQFEQGVSPNCEPLVKSDCHSEVNWDHMNLLRYSANKVLVSSAVYTDAQ